MSIEGSKNDNTPIRVNTRGRDTKDTLSNPIDSAMQMQDLHIRDRIRTSHAISSRLAQLLGAIGLEKLQAMVTPPPLDSMLSNIASKTNIPVEKAANVSSGASKSSSRKISGKEI